MRKRRLGWTLTILAIASGVVAGAPLAAAPKTLASYCSPSGDVCFGAVKRRGAIRLEITTAAKYFSRYTLCVRPPGSDAASRYVRCGVFPIFRHGSTWTSSVKLTRFPASVPGICRVTWKLGTKPLGPTLRFRVSRAGP